MVLRVLDDRDGRRAPGRAAVVIPRIQPVTERGSTRREKCAPGPAVGTSPELDVSGPGTAAPRPDFLVALACPRNRVILGMRRQDYLGQASRGWLWLSREGREAAPTCPPTTGRPRPSTPTSRRRALGDDPRTTAAGLAVEDLADDVRKPGVPLPPRMDVPHPENPCSTSPQIDVPLRPKYANPPNLWPLELRPRRGAQLLITPCRSVATDCGRRQAKSNGRFYNPTHQTI